MGEEDEEDDMEMQLQRDMREAEVPPGPLPLGASPRRGAVPA